MKISFDLDSVIFDMEPLYKSAFVGTGITYTKPTSWDLDVDYPPHIVKRLIELFGDDMLYTMPVIDTQIPYILNQIMQNPQYDVSFVTERRKKQPLKTFNQLRNAGINVDFSKVYDKEPKKVEVLKEIGTELHFDDSPNVVRDCLREGVNIVMISNDDTRYNHFLREYVTHYPSLRAALRGTKIYTK